MVVSRCDYESSVGIRYSRGWHNCRAGKCAKSRRVAQRKIGSIRIYLYSSSYTRARGRNSVFHGARVIAANFLARCQHLKIFKKDTFRSNRSGITWVLRANVVSWCARTISYVITRRVRRLRYTKFPEDSQTNVVANYGAYERKCPAKLLHGTHWQNSRVGRGFRICIYRIATTPRLRPVPCTAAETQLLTSL